MRNGSGTYIPPTNSWNPATNGNPATAADWQSVLNDLSSALTQSVSRDGQAPLTGNLPAGGNKITGLAAGTTAGDALSFGQAITGSSVTSTGDVNAVNVVASNNITATATVTGATVTSTGAVNGATVAATGAVTGASVTTTGAVNVGTNLAATGNVSGVNLTGSGVLTTSGIKENISGNVSIGTASSDGYRVRAYGVTQITSGYQLTYGGVAAASITIKSSGILAFGLDGSTGGTERATIDQSGNFVCTGTSTAASFSGAGTNLTGTANSLNAGIGVNQTWQNMNASRALATSYTNSTGKPIMVSITNQGPTQTTLSLTVSGIVISIGGVDGSGSNNGNSVCGIVPNGATYSCAGGAFTTWAELR